MPPDTIVAYLASHPFFVDLSGVALQRVAAMTAARALARGEVLALEGDPCDAVYLVVQGRLVSVKASREGREQIVSELRAGEIVYAVPALDGGPLPATTQAATRATVLRLGRAEFLGLLDDYPILARRLLLAFAGRLRRFGALVEDLSLRSVAQRLARLLAERAKSAGVSSAGDPMAGPSRLTQREMASQLGTVREVVARNLAQFEAAGWIRLRRGVIEITDLAALQAAAEY
jgi:CRP/FNR family transcriptional regulator